jgi:drug/metabolite transporter (DMT)-like permease
VAGATQATEHTAAAGVSDRATGLLLALTGVVLLSPDALIIRLLDESPSTILFWRGVFTAASLTVIVAVMAGGDPRRAFRAILPIGLVVAAFQAGANFSFVVAITNTTAANVLVIVGAAPLMAALLSQVVLREAVPRRTWVAIGCVIVGVTLVFSGTRTPEALLGDSISLIGASCAAAASVTVRRARAVSMVPAMALSAVICSGVALGFGVAVPSPPDMALLAVQGAVVVAGAMALITTAVRYLPAPEVSLIARLELVLGPLWVWAIVGETVPITTIASGAIIGTTLVAHTLLGMRADRRASVSSGLAGVSGR